jgi:phosphatidylinositol alpha 1,6-mannosyltransferase
VRRVLEHLAAEGHDAELVAPTGPATYAGFPVHLSRGASLPFYRDFRIGLETRARLRGVMLRYRPDVVHIASPATLGLQAARVAEELGIPSVAIYQTDLIGFAERYAVPGLGAGSVRAMSYLTRRIHTSVDRTLAPSTASLRQLEELDVPRLARWPRGVDLDGFHPGLRDEGLRRTIAADGRLLVGYVGRLAPEKELELLTYLSGDPRYALVVVGGGPDETRRCPPAYRSSHRAPAARSTWSTTGWPASSTSPATETTWVATSTGWSVTRSSGSGWAWPPAAVSRAAPGRRSTKHSWSTTAT